MDIQELKNEEKRLNEALAGIRSLIRFYEPTRADCANQSPTNESFTIDPKKIDRSTLDPNLGHDADTKVVVIEEIEKMLPTLDESFTTSNVKAILYQNFPQLKTSTSPSSITAALYKLAEQDKISIQSRGTGRRPSRFTKSLF